MRKVFFTSWACASLLLGGAAWADERDPWLTIRADDVEIYSEAGLATTTDIAAKLLRMRAAMARVSRLNTRSPVPIRLFLFRDAAGFAPFQRAVFGSEAGKGGAFVATSDANYIAIDVSARARAEGLVYHELTHYFLNNTWHDPPVWVGEGLAELYSTFDTTKREVFIGKPVVEHIQRLKRQQLIPLAQLVKVDVKSPLYTNPMRQSLFYAESWLLVHFILIGGGNPPEALLRLDVPYEDLERQLRQYLPRADARWIKLKVDDLPIATIPPPRIPHPDELQAHFGDFILHASKNGWRDARPYFVEALKTNADNALAHAGLAAIIAAEGGDPGAEYEAVVRLAPGKPFSAPAEEYLRRKREEKLIADVSRAEDLLVAGKTDDGVSLLRNVAATTTEPALRERATRMLHGVEVRQRHSAQIDRYNEAIAKANARDYPGSLAILDALIPTLDDEELAAAAKDLREQVAKARK